MDHQEADLCYAVRVRTRHSDSVKQDSTNVDRPHFSHRNVALVSGSLTGRSSPQVLHGIPRTIPGLSSSRIGSSLRGEDDRPGPPGRVF